MDRGVDMDHGSDCVQPSILPAGRQPAEQPGGTVSQELFGQGHAKLLGIARRPRKLAADELRPIHAADQPFKV